MKPPNTKRPFSCVQRYPIAASNGADVRLYGVLTKPGGATFEAYVYTAGDDTPRLRLPLVGDDRGVISFVLLSPCTKSI